MSCHLRVREKSVANPQHLAWLKEGVDAWNERQRNEPFIADLTEANLNGVELSQVNLIGADLARAELKEANVTRSYLREANLMGADFTMADLTDANFTRAKLQRADLTQADLTQADLTRANLMGADLSQAKLMGADLTRAKLAAVNIRSVSSTQLTNNSGRADLTFAKNLSQAQLETMDGDTGVLLPVGLVHPKDWPVWEDEPDDDKELDSAPVQDENSNTARAELVQKLEVASPVAAVVKDGKIDVTDMPPDGKPAANDPQDLAAQFEALGRLCETFLARWETNTPNVNQAIKDCVSQCLKSAQERDGNWYIWQDYVSEIDDRLDLDKDYDWRGTNKICERIKSRVLELKQYLKPLPVDPSASGDDEQAPQIKIDESTPEKIEDLSDTLDRTLQNPEIKAKLTDRSNDLGTKVLAGLQEGLTRAESIDPRLQDTAPGIWQRNVRKLAGFVLSLLKLVSTGAAANILSDALVDILKALRDALLRLFF